MASSNILNLIKFNNGDNTAPKDVIDLLKTDHRKVKDLFNQFEKSESNAEKLGIAKKIVKELKVHSTLEEEIIYPAIRKEEEKQDEDLTKIAEAYEEHHLVDILVDELSSAGKLNDQVNAKVKVLTEMVKHHIKEEESDVLPKIKEFFPDQEPLLARVMERRHELMKNGNGNKKTKTNGRRGRPAKKSS